LVPAGSSAAGGDGGGSGALALSARFGTLVVALLFALSAAAAGERAMGFGEFIPANPPQPAPQAGFVDLDGHPASLADFKGKPTIVNLWATWCRPCVKEMPSLDRLAARFAGRLAVAAVSEDRAAGTLVKPFIAVMKPRHIRMYLDPQGHLERAFHVFGVPTSIVLDAEGRVLGRVEGAADWDSARMRAVLRPLLKNAASPTHARRDAGGTSLSRLTRSGS
jgi:thiol-disulfide isomerase/thioredoxin